MTFSPWCPVLYTDALKGQPIDIVPRSESIAFRMTREELCINNVGDYQASKGALSQAGGGMLDVREYILSAQHGLQHNQGSTLTVPLPLLERLSSVFNATSTRSPAHTGPLDPYHTLYY